MARRLVQIILLFGFFLLPLYLRAIYESRDWLQQARSASPLVDKVDYYSRAVSWNAPFSGYAAAALQEFEQLAFQSPEAAPERIEALRRLRSAVWGSRNVWQGREFVRVEERARLEIDRLMAKPADGWPVQELHPVRVSYGWQIVAQLLFWGWIGSLLIFIWRGFDRQGGMLPGALPRLLVPCACYLGWLLALGRA